MNAAEHTRLLLECARDLGFAFTGIARAEFLEAEAPRLEQWLKQGYHGGMQYMENHFDKRLDPRLLVDGAKSVVSLLYNYHTEKRQAADTLKIAQYAYGEDYHDVIRDKLKILLERLRESIGPVNGRIFVDSGPVLERAWAERAGLGWNGKHTLLINKERGSYFFLAELILDIELEYDNPFPTDHCGTCTRCMDACPTEAIVAENLLDAGKCISYATIELKAEVLPEEFRGNMEDWIFGCDICQQVCPWNRFALPHHEPRFEPKPELLNMGRKDWAELTEETFGRLFKHSAIKRTKYRGLVRNIRFEAEK